MSSNIFTLDVRPDLRSGQHPFQKIMDALTDIGEHQAIRLLVPFEPVPLYHAAAAQGFGHKSNQTPEGDWEVIFTRVALPKPATRTSSTSATSNCNNASETIEVDARHLEPPQPMVRILESLAHLPEGVSLRAHTDRRPIHLYAQLEDRGFVGQSVEQSDGSFITHIRRA